MYPDMAILDIVQLSFWPGNSTIERAPHVGRFPIRIKYRFTLKHAHTAPKKETMTIKPPWRARPRVLMSGPQSAGSLATECPIGQRFAEESFGLRTAECSDVVPKLAVPVIPYPFPTSGHVEDMPNADVSPTTLCRSGSVHPSLL